MSYAGGPSGRSTTLSQINITPLIDVLLTVLVIFMITAPVMTQRMVRPLREDASIEKPAEPLVLGLSIRDTGEWLLDGRATNRIALGQSLHVAAAQGTPLKLEIRPEAHSSYDNLAQVLAIAQNNGISDLRVMAARSD